MEKMKKNGEQVKGNNKLEKYGKKGKMEQK